MASTAKGSQLKQQSNSLLSRLSLKRMFKGTSLVAAFLGLSRDGVQKYLDPSRFLAHQLDL